MGSSEHQIPSILLWLRTDKVPVVSTYTIYIHKTMLSSNEERRELAISNVQIAMQMASECVKACEISRTWRVVL